GKQVSEALGRKPDSTDFYERHSFDIEILRIPPGKAPYSYHSHCAWPDPKGWTGYKCSSAGCLIE
ncbi:MAG: hypothetical protein ABI233_08735, partial [Chthoniobacterales bacterium]